MNLYGKYFDFFSWLQDLYFWEDQILKCKSKHSVATAMMVLYGRKKDRGHIRKKYKELLKEYHYGNRVFLSRLQEKLGMEIIGGPYGRI